MVVTGYRKRRRAFSLVELMVVIAVSGLMIAMLLPAVQVARERSRATTCSNHMKQVGLALCSFESVHGHFPKGAEGRFDRNLSPLPMYGFSWWVPLLPHLEQSELADKLDRTHAYVGYVQLNSQNGELVNRFTPPFFYCPSSPVEKTVNAGGFQVAAPSFAAISGASNEDGFHESRVNKCCRSDGQISAGGILFPNDVVAINQITDGLSKTILLGEQSNYCYTTAGIPKRTAAAFVNGWLTGTRALDKPPRYTDPLTPAYNLATVRYRLNENRYDLPGIYEDIGANNPLLSAHPGFVNLLYGDGSIHATSDSIDVLVLKSIATRDDGSIIDVAQR